MGEIVSAADEIVSVTDRKGKIMSEIQELAQHIQDFPALVHKARMDKGITNEDLAELSGISYSAVCKMQSGERDPKLYDAVAVMKAVGISADQTFEIQPPASAPSAMRERIHELELDNAVSSGDVVRLKRVNGLCTQRLDGRYPPARSLQTLVCIFLNFCRNPLPVLNCLPFFRFPQPTCWLCPPGRAYSVCVACYPSYACFYRRVQPCRIPCAARC